MSDPTEKQSTRSIELEIEIEATPDAVWKALSEGEEVRRWFSPEARVTPGVGGSIWLSWGEGVAGEGAIDIWEPGRRIRWIESWGSAGDADGDGDETNSAATTDADGDGDETNSAATTDAAGGEPTSEETDVSAESSPIIQTAVDFHIETRGGSTVVRLVHSGFSASADWDEYYDATVAGWTYFLWNLAFYVERHFGTPRTMVSERRSTTRGFEDVWNELLGSSGLALEGLEGLTAGDRLTVTLGDRTLVGDVKYVRHPRNLAGTLKELNDGLLFVEMEPSGGETWSCGVWISAYGVAEAETTALQAQLTALVDRVFS